MDISAAVVLNKTICGNHVLAAVLYRVTLSRSGRNPTLTTLFKMSSAFRVCTYSSEAMQSMNRRASFICHFALSRRNSWYVVRFDDGRPFMLKQTLDWASWLNTSSSACRQYSRHVTVLNWSWLRTVVNLLGRKTSQEDRASHKEILMFREHSSRDFKQVERLMRRA